MARVRHAHTSKSGLVGDSQASQDRVTEWSEQEYNQDQSNNRHTNNYLHFDLLQKLG